MITDRYARIDDTARSDHAMIADSGSWVSSVHEIMRKDYCIERDDGVLADPDAFRVGFVEPSRK